MKNDRNPIAEKDLFYRYDYLRRIMELNKLPQIQVVIEAGHET